MLTLDTLGGAAAPSFEQPLEMLQACHDKIRRFCDTLDKLPPYIEEHGVDEAARNAINDVVRYFDVAGPAHHTDEEEELFPLIEARVPAAASRLEQLAAEHGYLHSCWNAIRDDLLSLRDGRIRQISKNELQEFARQYREHAAAEEAWLFPAAASALSAEELRAAGARMAQRRQTGG
ncbi:hemerythrin domain-containing protein [Chromobacterium subtsugae]|uniref:Hemerythrin domain-containing protein n=1 Tax=Chromobacterium subtsugae TaxID=251747 RepID=A0ABS7FDZ2_9NEIS|nr:MULTISPECIES: hemerythrin domain-containing protein [Chromobacterium]KUM03888.1 cation-binding protein [Chromobacterium subtsugae]KZE87451.1 cation-binding protein [Chromobacterium sp. F49]MBW7566600.1 hemerythrin domain-containing protein [Chromobacterium subtsugae]MBW8288287.1 hemerythrin domain-containing protein [Chromobacterium subtsugae]OBU87264.1 cation-binding protein [Chromobacterium subtsugae]